MTEDIRTIWKRLHRARRVARREAAKGLSDLLIFWTGMTITDVDGTRHVPFVDSKLIAQMMERAVNPPLITDTRVTRYEIRTVTNKVFSCSTAWNVRKQL